MYWSEWINVVTDRVGGEPEAGLGPREGRILVLAVIHYMNYLAIAARES